MREFVDHCEHGQGDYLGTVVEGGQLFDVYAYESDKGWFETCCRFGNSPENYRSGEGGSTTKIRLWKDRETHWLIAAWCYRKGIKVEWIEPK